MSTPGRLPWPEGSVLYEAAPPEAHVEATRQLQPLKARVPRGCLLRRVSLTLPVSTTSTCLPGCLAVCRSVCGLSMAAGHWLRQCSARCS